jgi:LmbE family N-acetylglucosaminyl deacetylase
MIDGSGQRCRVTLSTVHEADSGRDPAAWDLVVRGMEPWECVTELRAQLVVVSPHPDDETLGVGGLIAEAARLHVPVVVLSVTDGEAAATSKERLGSRRQREMRNALSYLVQGRSLRTVRCGLPDGGVVGRVNELEEILAAEIQQTDLVLAPLSYDGHSDHDAIGVATRGVARRKGATCGFYPIWAWHWHDPDRSPIATNGRRLDLSPEASLAKARALGCFPSQTAGSPPVLPEHFLRRFNVPYEVIVSDYEPSTCRQY